MGGSTTTKVEQAPPSEEEKRYLDSQAALTNKQLEILGSQSDFNQSYMDQIRPILEQQVELQKQQLAAQLDPTAQKAATDIANKSNDIQVQQLDIQRSYLQQQQDQIAQDRANAEAQGKALAPIQELQSKLLQKQIDALDAGNGPTPEQISNIDAATNAAFESGKSDINSYTADALEQLRTGLSPTLGLRPTDTPIVDRAGRVQQEAARQVGQLRTNLAGANATARLNYPLAVQQTNDASSQFQQQLKLATEQFQSGLSDAAATNRLRLMSSASDIISGGTQSGIGLAAASRGNPLSFTRDSTNTTQKQYGLGDYLMAIGGGLQSAASISKSDARAKYDVKTVGHDDAGHRWVHFKYKGDPAHADHVGVIAQEAEEISPEAVLTDGTGTKWVNYKRLRRAA